MVCDVATRIDNPLLAEDGTPVPEEAARNYVLATIGAAERQLPDPAEFHLEWDDWDGRGYVYNEDGALPSLETEEIQDIVIERWQRDWTARLGQARRTTGPMVSRLRADFLEWGAAYEERWPAEGHHERPCGKHAVCRVLYAYRQGAGNYHALAQTPRPERDDAA